MSRAIRLAADAFFDFCRGSESWTTQPESVEEYLESWLESGNATRACAGEFRIFVCAVALIFAEWHDERFVECKAEADWHSSFPWRVTRALKGDEVSTDIFDPLYFRYCYIQDNRS